MDTPDPTLAANVASLSPKDKSELQQFIQNESQKARIQQTTHNLTDMCWRKCVTGTIRSGTLDKSEDACTSNCVNRFLDANFLIIKHLEGMRNTQ